MREDRDMVRILKQHQGLQRERKKMGPAERKKHDVEMEKKLPFKLVPTGKKGKDGQPLYKFELKKVLRTK